MTNLTKICIKNKEQNTTIDAQKLLEYIKKVENGENIPGIEGLTIKKIEENEEIVVVDVEGIINGDLDIRGISIDFQLGIIKKINEKKLKINGDIYFGGNIKGIEKLCDNENLIIPGSLDISGTNVEKINLKKVIGNIWAEGVKTLKEIDVTEGIDGNLEIKGTSVKKISANIMGSINARKVETLEEINIPEIHGYLDISGTNVEKLNLKKVLGDIYANGVTTLKEIEVTEGIEGDLYIEGTNVKKITAKKVLGNINAKKVETLEEIDVLKIGKKLIINGTKIKKIKAQKVLGDINATGLITLEEIKVEEEIGGSLFIIGTNVKKITAKKVLGDIRANGVETLEEINIPEINGDFNIKGTSIDFQLGIIEKKKNGKLKINGRIFYDKEAINTLNITIDAEELKKYIKNVEKTKKTYNKDGIKIEWISKKNIVDVNVEGMIKGNLDIRGTSVDFQKKILEKKKNGELKVTGKILYDEEAINTLNIIINAEELIKYIKKVENGENIPDIEGLTIKKIEENGKIVVDVQGVIKGDLVLKYTKVKTIKAKKIGGGINAELTETLEEINIPEINGGLNLRRSNIRKIKANKIWGDINAEGVETLEEINIEGDIKGNLNLSSSNIKEMNVEKIIGNLNIIGTSANFQKKILEKIENGDLNIKGNILYNKKIINIEELKKYINYVIKTKKTYNSGGIKIEWISKKNAVDVEVKGIINGDLDIRGIKVKNITTKKVLGSVFTNGIKTLEEINIPEINGDLDIRGTSVDFQKKVLEKKKNGELTITGELFSNI